MSIRVLQLRWWLSCSEQTAKRHGGGKWRRTRRGGLVQATELGVGWRGDIEVCGLEGVRGRLGAVIVDIHVVVLCHRGGCTRAQANREGRGQGEPRVGSEDDERTGSERSRHLRCARDRPSPPHSKPKETKKQAVAGSGRGDGHDEWVEDAKEEECIQSSPRRSATRESRQWGWAAPVSRCPGLTAVALVDSAQDNAFARSSAQNSQLRRQTPMILW